MDAQLRQSMINETMRILHEEVHVIPLHRQVNPWVTRAGVVVHHMPINTFRPEWAKVP